MQEGSVPPPLFRTYSSNNSQHGKFTLCRIIYNWRILILVWQGAILARSSLELAHAHCTSLTFLRRRVRGNLHMVRKKITGGKNLDFFYYNLKIKLLKKKKKNVKGKNCRNFFYSSSVSQLSNFLFAKKSCLQFSWNVKQIGLDLNWITRLY